jgi:hypothetical protein
MDVSDARKLKSLEVENARLKKLLAESNRDSAGAAATTRTIALLDGAVASLRESGDILSTLAVLRPRALAMVEFLGSTLTGWQHRMDKRFNNRASPGDSVFTRRACS